VCRALSVFRPIGADGPMAHGLHTPWRVTGSQRTNLDYVLENVLDPSAVVAWRIWRASTRL